MQIHNCENMERDFVLKNLTAAVHPLDLIPVFYQSEKEYASFLVRNCGAAIVKFCRQNLMVHNPENPNKPVSNKEVIFSLILKSLVFSLNWLWF